MGVERPEMIRNIEKDFFKTREQWISDGCF